MSHAQNLRAERTVQAAPRPEAQPQLLSLDSGSGLGDLKALKAWKDLIANPPKSIRPGTSAITAEAPVALDSSILPTAAASASGLKRR